MHVDSDQFARADSAISQIECHFREQETTVECDANYSRLCTETKLWVPNI